ncbi:MAG TPA: hypothetical protein DCX14_11105 [Flavobacteriales bacterium]|nr:hypothetical protein [Flavobacteriales bacterium]
MKSTFFAPISLALITNRITFLFLSCCLFAVASCSELGELPFADLNRAFTAKNDSILNTISPDNSSAHYHRRSDIIRHIKLAKSEMLHRADSNATSIYDTDQYLNYYVPTEYMVDEGHAAQLKKLIDIYQHEIRKTLNGDTTGLGELEISTKMIEVNEGELLPWEQSFGYTPLIAVFTELSKIEMKVNLLYVEFEKRMP